MDNREIASTLDGRDITRGYVDPLALLQPQDDILQYRGGGDYDIYRQVLSDPQVAAGLQQRRLAITRCEWTVEAGGKHRAEQMAADQLREQLHHIRFDAVTGGMHYGVFYGYAVAEALYAREGGRVMLDAVRVRDRRRFAYAGPAREPDPDWESQLRLRTTSHPQGERIPSRKFWHFATGADHDDEPYGLGLAHWCYWPVLFKRTGTKFWLIGLEKFGSPTAVGKYPPSATAAERQRLLYTLGAIQTDSGVIVPEGIMIELLKGQAGTVDYQALLSYMDAMIAKTVLGQVMTLEAVGGQYKAEVQNEVREDLVKADADLICDSFNRSVVRWLTEWNYGPGVAPPRVWRQTEESEDLDARAKREKLIFDMGYKPTLAHITETYGGEWEPVTAPAPSVPPTDPAPEFAEAMATDQRRLDAALDALLGNSEALQQIAEEMVQPVLEALDNDGPEATLGRLAELYPSLNDEALQQLLARIIFVADTWGRLNAERD